MKFRIVLHKNVSNFALVTRTLSKYSDRVVSWYTDSSLGSPSPEERSEAAEAAPSLGALPCLTTACLAKRLAPSSCAIPT